MSDDVQLVREIGEVKAELSAVKAELAGLRERIDDVVISNLRDHGKRMSMLETRVAALEARGGRRIFLQSSLPGDLGQQADPECCIGFGDRFFSGAHRSGQRPDGVDRLWNDDRLIVDHVSVEQLVPFDFQRR